VRWSADGNIAWKVALPGRGASTPVVWNDHIFLTSQVGEDAASAGGAKGGGSARPTGKPLRFVIQCFHRSGGRQVWRHEFDADENPTTLHKLHNLATPSCVTNGKLMFAWFGTGQLVCLDARGRLVWERHLGREYGPFKVSFGHGSSPTLYEKTILLLCDHGPTSYLLALDQRTGRTLWKVDRGAECRSYSTPVVARTGHGDELIVNSSPRIDAYDPGTGRLLWYADGRCAFPVPAPVYADGILYASRGYRSGPYMAIRLGGRGDVTQSHVVWRVPTGAAYVSSLLYREGLVYMATENGIVFCADARTGQTLWKERLEGAFYASPVGAGGKIYLLNEAGETFVLSAGTRFSLLERNPLGETCVASPAISRGRIYIRSERHLFCIGKD
jgi:outer membrane protein assembly factor BamB